MDKNVNLLFKKFYKIRNLDYVRSVRNGPTGVGATFEYLIGKEEENFEIPDFYNIEIKTRRAYSKSYISLFCAVPTGGTFNESKRLRDNYGYRDPIYNDLKQLYTQINAYTMTKVGLWHYFKLCVDKDNKKLILNIYNYKQELIDNITYWDFDILEEKLYRKLKILALVKAWNTYKDGIEFFKYYWMNVYKLKNFDAFIDAIVNGKVCVSLRIGSFHDEKRYGQVSNHGVGFVIKEEDLFDIYDAYK